MSRTTSTLPTRGAIRLARRGRPRASSVVADHALRRARLDTPPAETWASWRFVRWLGGRLLALTVVVGTGVLVQHAAGSEALRVRTVRVTGAVLLSQAEVEQVAAVAGANLFWVDRRAVQDRLLAVPLVRRAEVVPVLPDTVEVRLVERRPTGFWISGERTYLVDARGTVLRAASELQGRPEARACGGQVCDPSVATDLPRVAQVDDQELRPGATVNAGALTASASLAALLPRAGLQPLAFEWSRDTGLQVPLASGVRVRFDGRADLPTQVSTFEAIREHLAASRLTAQVVDVRFADRPYFR